MLRILHVIGARPNFMKIAPIHSELSRHAQEVHQKVVHTGQHYDHNMSAVFFDELQLPKPDFNLEVGSASHAAQPGLIMQRFECRSARCSLVKVDTHRGYVPERSSSPSSRPR